MGSKKPQKVGNHFCGQREGGDWGGGQNTGKAPLPKGSWRESGKLETATGTKLKGKKEKGERRQGLSSIKTLNKGSTESATPQFYNWQCSGGKGESPGAEWGPGGSRATQGKAVPLLVETVRPPGPSRPQKMTTFAGAGTRSLRAKPGARCVL